MGNIGIPELIVIFILALLVFGPRKLPELGRTLGKALAEFRRASSEFRSAMEQEVRELERHAQDLETQAREVVETPPELPPGAPGNSLAEAVAAGSIDPHLGAPAAEAHPPEEKPPDGQPKPV